MYLKHVPEDCWDFHYCLLHHSWNSPLGQNKLKSYELDLVQKANLKFLVCMHILVDFFKIKSLTFGYPVYLTVWFHSNEDKGSWIVKWCFCIQECWQKWRAAEFLCFFLGKKFQKEGRDWEWVSWHPLLCAQCFGPHCGAAGYVNSGKYAATGSTCSAVKGQQNPGITFINHNVKDCGVILNSCIVKWLFWCFPVRKYWLHVLCLLKWKFPDTGS